MRRSRAVQAAADRVKDRVKEGIWDWLTARSLGSMVIALGTVLGVGVVGYMVFGGLGPIDALYMAVITFSTVGYGDETTGTPARLFTVVYLLVSVGVVSLSLSRAAAAMVEGRIRQVLGRRRMEQRIEALEGHVILCGYGRFGQIAAAELAQSGIPLVVIDLDPQTIHHAEDNELLGLAADATEEDTLVRAGLARSRALLCALPSDADNVYTILTARDVSRDVQIVALARDRKAERKLKVAGANHVVSPYSIGAHHMARQIISPHVAQVVSMATSTGRGRQKLGVKMKEVRVRTGSALDGVTLRESPLRSEFGVIVVAIIGADGESEFSPAPDHVMNAGDVLVAVGSDDGLDRLLSDQASAPDA